MLRSQPLIHSEISEALAELDATQLGMRIDDGKPEGFVVELADVIIRVCDTMQALGLSFADEWPAASQVALPIKANDVREHIVSQRFDQMRCNVDRATECVREDDWLNYTHALWDVVYDVVNMAALHGLDLPAAIEAKMAYNATRPTRHGGERA